MRRSLLHAFTNWFVKTFLRLDASGLENIPQQGGLLLATNHLSLLDAVIIFALVRRKDLTALVTTKYRRIPLISWLVNGVNGIWINREEADVEALRAARNHLKAGGGLGIAPEGTRSKTGGLIPAKTGVAFLADKSESVILPVAISGTESAFQKITHLQRPAIRIVFGQPFQLPRLPRQDRDAALQRNTDEIMCQIAALLPLQYRGVYAEHPRLKALLEARGPEVSILN
jgi:1-acyl-sn-glycerol-3-phosphate acyltransferase